MGLREIRETIVASGQTDANGLVQFQKRINLTPGLAHTIQHIDFFDDGALGATNSSADFSYQVWLTNYPIVITDEVFHSGSMRMGPMAGDDNVLYKAHSLLYGVKGVKTFNEFPNQFLGSQPTFEFYTPTLYFTVAVQSDNVSVVIGPSIKMSIYLALEETNADPVEYGIGILQEFAENQAMLRRKNGVRMDRARIIGAMPMWQIGGIRPEIMAEPSGNVFGEGWFFGAAGYGDGEVMTDTAGVRAGLRFARTMVDSTSAFGDQALDIPDWFKAITKNFPGLEAGPLRSQWPPILHEKNGNVIMV
tara:strand:+ start:706 stop:1620 length:915 start_codon:yes stop_codon:yes gene_type:complete